MLIWLIPAIIVVVSTVVVLFVMLRHIKEVAAIDVESDPARRTKGQKKQLFTKRIERLSSGRAKVVGRVVGKAARGGKGIVKKVYLQAQALDRHYKRLQKEQVSGQAGSHENRRQLREEAEALMAKEAFTGAEARLIELLSLDQKNPEVYELLGIVYFKTRQWDQARETFEYARKLAPEDASILVYLGELALRDGAVKDAMHLFKAAVDVRPTNPKYLDFLIESSILAADAKMAREGLWLLGEANPDNNKIEEFRARIERL